MNAIAGDRATLNIPGREPIELQVIPSTLGPGALDASALFRGHKVLLGTQNFDPVAAARSGITYIDPVGDGKDAVLLHRGYPIAQLGERYNFLEVAHLLICGELPTPGQALAFQDRVEKYSFIHPSTRKHIASLDTQLHPMSMLGSEVMASPFQFDKSAPSDEESTFMLLAQMPIIAAMIHRHRTGQEFIEPRNDLGYVGNYLYMRTGIVPTDLEKEVFNKIFILHADHEQNAGTTVARAIKSTHVNNFASLTGAIGALWGPRHGGANQEVMETLDRLLRKETTKEELLALATHSDEKKRVLLPGFGHRVYKAYDPRAAVMQKLCQLFLGDRATDDPYLREARALEKMVLADPTFRRKMLYPNVDFYSGILQHAMGVPTDQFTVTFALGRTAGWLAQIKEMMDQGNQIVRPRQVYVGPGHRDVPARSTELIY